MASSTSGAVRLTPLMVTPTCRAIRGGCRCGRNRYLVYVPTAGAHFVRVVFETNPLHRVSLGAPIPAFLRVPLPWHVSRTRPFFPDETPAMIRRVYEAPSTTTSPYDSPSSPYTKRHFCGFCGTPLAFWSESPPAEAAFIRIPLGTLRAEDLGSLDEWMSDESSGEYEDEVEDEVEDEGKEPEESRHISPTGLPWLDSYVEGSLLGRRLQQQERQRRRQTPNLTHSVGSAQSTDGTVRVEWEISEWTEGDEVEEETSGEAGKSALADQPSPAKRPKHGVPDDGE